MKKVILCMISLVIASGALAQAKQKKAVFVIVDGIPADVIERVETPALDEISSKGGYTRAYMGGEAGGLTQTPTISAVCYNTLLTGTWGNKHNVWDNDIAAPNYNYWNIFRIAKNQSYPVRTAVFSSWLDNRTKLIGEGLPEAGGFRMDYAMDGLELDTEKYPAEPHEMHIFKIDEAISEGAAACIREDAPDLMWVYLWYMDCVGHEFGDSERFDEYTALTDRQVSRIWEAVKEREKNYDEEWMVVITTDHGRSASDGKGHGGQSERERTVWISTNQLVSDYFRSAQPATVDVVPSICRYMGYTVPVDLSYEQEGAPFVGKIDLANLKARKEGDQIRLTWEGYSKEPLAIYMATTNHYKEGGKDEWKRVGKVSADKNSFTYKIKGAESPFYKFSVRGENNSLPVWVKSE